MKLYCNGPCLVCFNHAELHQAMNVYPMFLLQRIVKQSVLCAEQIGLMCVRAGDKRGSFEAFEVSLLSALSAIVVSKWISVGLMMQTEHFLRMLNI